MSAAACAAHTRQPTTTTATVKHARVRVRPACRLNLRGNVGVALDELESASTGAQTRAPISIRLHRTTAFTNTPTLSKYRHRSAKAEGQQSRHRRDFSFRVKATAGVEGPNCLSDYRCPNPGLGRPDANV